MSKKVVTISRKTGTIEGIEDFTTHLMSLSPDALVEWARPLVSTQSYEKKQMIDGVRIIDVRRMHGEDGTFEELLRLDEKGCMPQVPEFQVRQINRSRLLKGAIKAWHLHFNQEDLWYVSPEDCMLLGLWDLRQDSPTKEMKMKIPLGFGTSRLILIPRGVAHGVANIGNRSGTILYYVNQQFSVENPDERRLAWDAAGADFWVPEKG